MPIESARPLGTRHANERVRSGGAASRRTPGRTFRRTHGAVRADHELRATHAHRASWNQRSDWFERSMSSIVDLVTALVVALAQDDRSCFGDPGRHSRGGACGDKTRSFSSWCSVRLAWMRASALWRFQRNLTDVSRFRVRSRDAFDRARGCVTGRCGCPAGGHGWIDVARMFSVESVNAKGKFKVVIPRPISRARSLVGRSRQFCRGFAGHRVDRRCVPRARLGGDRLIDVDEAAPSAGCRRSFTAASSGPRPG